MHHHFLMLTSVLQNFLKIQINFSDRFTHELITLKIQVKNTRLQVKRN